MLPDFVRTFVAWRVGFVILYLAFSGIFILPSRENYQNSVTSSLRSYQRSVYHHKRGNPSKCFSQRHNKQTGRLVLHIAPLMLSIKQESCEYQFYSHWFDPTRNQTQVYSSRNIRSTPLCHWNCVAAFLMLFTL